MIKLTRPNIGSLWVWPDAIEAVTALGGGGSEVILKSVAFEVTESADDIGEMIRQESIRTMAL